MKRIVTTIKVILFLLVFGVLHYVLPQHDVGRITGTEVIRQDFSRWNRLFFAQADSGNVEYQNRDVLFINVVRKKTLLFGFIRRDTEGQMVYRNEDTGWIWPPYFKFDTRDLDGEAKNLTSTAENPKWVVVTHYGWRNRYLTIFPNAIGIRPVEGPDVTVIPWFNIFFFGFLIVGLAFLRAAWRQFRQRAIDPTLEDMEESWDAVGDNVSEKRGRLTRWLGTWRRKS